ncbi:hypothetical protein HPB49_017691 [Dermacentor silvarum]|uniref:Uncharacterized protein n=1 Tax=Dermacentor silvarum TaxID=543639 RepID=A0ACB8DQK5_DERSI|nr:hypothetical protein HPB49_017691 [Dermacentor silvarum]
MNAHLYRRPTNGTASPGIDNSDRGTSSVRNSNDAVEWKWGSPSQPPMSWMSVCMKCREVADETMQLPCGHIFCKSCLNDACDRGRKRARREDGSSEDKQRRVTCPLDRHSFLDSHLTRLSFTAEDKNCLPVRCSHAEVDYRFL